MFMQSDDVINECGCYSGIGSLLALSSMPRRFFSFWWFVWVCCGCGCCCVDVKKHLSEDGCCLVVNVVLIVALSRSAVQMFWIQDCCNTVWETES